MKVLTLIDKAFILKRTPMFGMLDLDLLLVISDKLEALPLHPGDYVFASGEAASRMFFVVKGVIQVVDMQKKQIALLHPPEFFGDEALLSEAPRKYDARCQTESLLLSLSKTNLLTILSECPQVAIGLLQAYTSLHDFRPRKSEGQ